MLAATAPPLSDGTIAFRHQTIATTLARLAYDRSLGQRLRDERGGVTDELIARSSALLVAAAWTSFTGGAVCRWW